MRFIGELDSDKAVVFASFLLVKGIDSQVDPQDGGLAEVWVKDEDQFKLAMADLEEFKSDPSNQKYSQAVQEAKSLAKAEEKRRKAIQKKIVNVRAVTQRRPTLTLVLIGISAIVALLTEFGGERYPRDGQIYKALQFAYVGPPALEQVRATTTSVDSLAFRWVSLSRGEIWRTVTPIFIHYGIFHILFNMMWLFQFGKLIENRYGMLKYGLLVLAVAVLSNIAQGSVPDGIGGSRPYLISETALLTVFGGMSGVVYGLFGFVWMKSVYDRRAGFRISDTTVLFLMGWLFFCMIPPEMIARILPFSFPSTANWAHGVGLLVGMAVGYGSTILRDARGG
ncbi:MAG: rhomboid family intramembrane serine protease [Mariniblastus sp.]